MKHVSDLSRRLARLENRRRRWKIFPVDAPYEEVEPYLLRGCSVALLLWEHEQPPLWAQDWAEVALDWEEP